MSPTTAPLDALAVGAALAGVPLAGGAALDAGGNVQAGVPLEPQAATARARATPPDRAASLCRSIRPDLHDELHWLAMTGRFRPCREVKSVRRSLARAVGQVVEGPVSPHRRRRVEIH